MRRRPGIECALIISMWATHSLRAQTPSDTVSVHLHDVDLRAAVEVLGQYLDRPIVISNVNGAKVTIETPKAVRRRDIVGLLRATLEGQNLELVSDTAGPYRIRQKEQPQPPPAAPPAHAGGPTQLFVIHLQHARAADVAATVNALYGRASAFGEMGAPQQPHTLSQQLQQNQMQMPGVPPGQAVSGDLTNGRQATLAGETTIVPDAGTNSLLIRASQDDYALITAAVKELDIRPLQVLIEVVIVELTRNRSLSFGLGVNLPPTPLRGHPNTTVSGTQTGLTGGDVSLQVLGIGGVPDLQATLTAASSRGDVNILSRPSVLAVNNEQAQINIGSQRPFVQLQRTLPTDNAAQDQVVQYEDVGTKLTIRPTISADGYVMLQVSQEVNQATAEVAFNAPVISTRSVQTQLLLKDGQTVVIGGLTDREHTVTQEGVPLLSHIPLVGGLFGQTSRSTTETELFLFITPRVIKTDDDATTVTEPAKKQAGLKDR